MIRIITFLALLPCFALTAQGQITLGAGDFALPGLDFKYYLTDTTSANTSLVNLGSPGANGTYEVLPSAASHIIETVTYHYIAPSASPFPTQHPNSNVAFFTYPVMLDAGIGTPDTVAWLWSYLSSSSTGLVCNGLSAIIDTQMFSTTIPGPLVPFSKNYSPGLTIMSSAFNLGYHVHDSIYHCIVLGNIFPIARTEYITRDILIDGYGTLTTPKGTYDVLRGKVAVLRAENYVLPADTSDMIFTDFFWEYYYEFYAKGIGAPVCLLHMNSTYDSVLTINYTDAPPAGIPEQRSTVLSVYPNPAADQIQIGIEMNAGKPRNIIITDLTGRIVMEVSDPILSPINTVSVDVSDLPPGNYFIRLSGKQQIQSARFVRM